MNAVIIRIIDLPYKVNGMTVIDSEGDYNVYLNAKHGTEKQCETFRHEINHIKMGHFYTNSGILQKELEADGYNR